MSPLVQEALVGAAAVAAGGFVLWRVVRAFRPSATSQPACDNCASNDLTTDAQDKRS
jgi:hypothetical protein